MSTSLRPRTVARNGTGVIRPPGRRGGPPRACSSACVPRAPLPRRTTRVRRLRARDSGADRRIAERSGPKARTGRGGGTGTGLTWQGAPAGPDLARVAADARAVEREHLAIGREQPQEDKLLRCSRCVQLTVFELPAMHCALVVWSAARECTSCILARSLSSRLTKQKLRARPAPPARSWPRAGNIQPLSESHRRVIAPQEGAQRCGKAPLAGAGVGRGGPHAFMAVECAWRSSTKSSDTPGSAPSARSSSFTLKFSGSSEALGFAHCGAHGASARYDDST
jgi:hypothetical protein